MSVSQIDTSKMPAQRWLIGSHSTLPLRTASNALTKMPTVAAKSPRASEANILRNSVSLESQLFDNAAELKIVVGQIAMHLTAEWRFVVFKQLDQLLAVENWQDDSALILRATFVTFLRFIVLAAPTRLPNLGVGPTGNILAAWKHGDQLVAVEFLSEDRARASFVRQGTHSKEAVVWRGHVADLKLFIERNNMIYCTQDSDALPCKSQNSVAGKTYLISITLLDAVIHSG